MSRYTSVEKFEMAVDVDRACVARLVRISIGHGATIVPSLSATKQVVGISRFMVTRDALVTLLSENWRVPGECIAKKVSNTNFGKVGVYV